MSLCERGNQLAGQSVGGRGTHVAERGGVKGAPSTGDFGSYGGGCVTMGSQIQDAGGKGASFSD